MRRLFYRRLTLEQLEARDLTNMPFGQVGTPVSGLPSGNSEASGLDGSSLVALNAMTRSAGDALANNGLLSHASAKNGHVTAIGGTDHHCCSHAYIGGSLLLGSPAIANGSAFWQTTSDNQAFGSQLPAFDSMADNPFDSAFPSAKNASPVFAGGGESGMSFHAGVSDNAASPGVGSVSGSSSGIGGPSAELLGSPPGSFPLTAAQPSGPMMLFPSGHSPSPVVAGTQKPSPGSSSISPAFGSRPDAVQCFSPVCLAAPPYVPVNADDDNGSAVTNGIPAIRDFSKQPLTNDDPDLLSATLFADTSLPPPPNGSWTVSITPLVVPGTIALWTDRMKTARFSPSGLGTFKFYIEGTHESASLNELTLTFTYNYTDINNVKRSASASATITVTPLINSFSVTPNSDAGDPNKQNIVFANGPNANSGLQAATPSRAEGALFKAVVLKGPLRGDLRFIQNVLDLNNGANGTKINNAVSVGWLFANNTSSNWFLKQGSFPVLDIDPTKSTDQTYVQNFSSTLSPDGNTITITDVDAPSTGFPMNSQNGITEDVEMSLVLHLVWRWIQNVGGTNVSVFYPLAYVYWWANFYAKGTVVNGVLTPPINNIVILKGVTSYTYGPNNSPPSALDMSTIFNGNNDWV
jgi:hypothetical protein